MISTGRVWKETRQHQPGQAVADFTLSLPPSVDVCTLHVRISAGNSAGMSAPSEVIEVGELQSSEIKFMKFETIICSLYYSLFR